MQKNVDYFSICLNCLISSRVLTVTIYICVLANCKTNCKHRTFQPSLSRLFSNTRVRKLQTCFKIVYINNEETYGLVVDVPSKLGSRI